MTSTIHIQTPSVTIDQAQVRRMAESFAAVRTAEDFAEQLTPRVAVDDETLLRAQLWSAAICHATKGGLEGYFADRYFKGWDYLLRAFLFLAERDPAAVSPERMETIDADGLTAALTAVAERSAVDLSDAPRRAQILATTARELQELYAGQVTTLVARSAGTLTGPTGMYRQLERLAAFQDPLRKKSSAFLMTVHFAGRHTFVDAAQAFPMIDYHRMRLLLRTGCITVGSSALALALRQEQSVPKAAEEEIRQASMQICMAIPAMTQMPMFDFDVLLWAHARSCCRRGPVCVTGRQENDSFSSYAPSAPTSSCVFQTWCSGATDSSIRSLWEPLVDTEDY